MISSTVTALTIAVLLIFVILLVLPGFTYAENTVTVFQSPSIKHICNDKNTIV